VGAPPGAGGKYGTANTSGRYSEFFDADFTSMRLWPPADARTAGGLKTGRPPSLISTSRSSGFSGGSSQGPPSFLAPRMIVMPLPFTTFGEIKDAGYEVVVWCQGCRHRRLIEITDAIRDRPFAGQRFRAKARATTARRATAPACQ